MSSGRKSIERWILGTFTAVFFTAMVIPIAVVVVVAFTDSNFVAFPITAWSLRWFHRIFEYEPFMRAFVVSLQIAASATLLSCLLGVPAAIALARSNSVFANSVMSFMLSPLSAPMIVLGFASLFFFSRIGVGLSFMALLIAHTVVCMPYVLRTVAGVYRGVPISYQEAASLLGASSWRSFWHITFPLIRPGVVAGSLFSFLSSFDNLPISYFFGSPDTMTLPVMMLSYMENQFDPSIAALSCLQLVLAVTVLLVVDRMYGIGRLTVSQ